VAKGEYVLVVEDNSGDATLLRQSLKEHGVALEVVVLTDGERAMRFMDEVDDGIVPCPALVVLDLNLPRKTGSEVLRRIRRSASCGTVPVAICSSSDADKDKEEAARLGANRYIRKPSNIEEFLHIGAVLKGLLDSR
jgi:DNA-binding response OmpR family regulator